MEATSLWWENMTYPSSVTQSKIFSGQNRNTVPSENFGSRPGPPPCQTYKGNLQREGTRRHPDQKPWITSADSFQSSSQMTGLLTLCLRLRYGGSSFCAWVQESLCIQYINEWNKTQIEFCFESLVSYSVLVFRKSLLFSQINEVVCVVCVFML